MAICFASPLIIFSCCWSQPLLLLPFLGYFLWARVVSKAELKDGAAWPWFSIQEWGFHVPWSWQKPNNKKFPGEMALVMFGDRNVLIQLVFQGNTQSSRFSRAFFFMVP